MTEGRKVHLDHLCELGVLRRFGAFDYTVVERPSAVADADLIWLPNTIVTGTDQCEESPVRRLRGGGDVWPYDSLSTSTTPTIFVMTAALVPHHSSNL